MPRPSWRDSHQENDRLSFPGCCPGIVKPWASRRRRSLGYGAEGGVPHPLSLSCLVRFEQTPSGPVPHAWRTPVAAPADRGEVAARGVIGAPTDGGPVAAGRVACAPTDHRAVAVSAVVVPAADGGEGAAGRVAFSPTDRGRGAIGRVPLPPTDGGEGRWPCCVVPH